MNLYAVATIVCDEHDDGRQCTEAAEYKENLLNDSARNFADRATNHFKDRGWRVGPLHFCYCPTHNKRRAKP